MGGTFVIMSPSPNIGGTCPPCPIGIDAPESRPSSKDIVYDAVLMAHSPADARAKPTQVKLFAHSFE